ncbi:DUF6932 family protein [Xanthomonas arboricola]|uniref:DUF6932 family protein n=1 Tax=Xanthomonas arboricola TaxID=56448 RepID=UPI004040A7FF
MPKVDFPALLQPGIHQISLQGLFSITVDAFPDNDHRQQLFSNLSGWAASLNEAGLSGKLWIDGSFLTQKPEPGDIDLVIWYPSWRDLALDTLEHRSQIESLLDQARAKALWNLDIYIEMPDEEGLLHREAYWRGLLGFCHDRITAKGLAEVAI